MIRLCKCGTRVFESNKCLNYRIFKKQFGFETYLNNLPNKPKKSLTKFRCGNNLLPIDIGSYYIFQGMKGWTGKDGSPTLGTIIKKSYDGSSVLSTSLGSKTLNNTSSLGLGEPKSKTQL